MKTLLADESADSADWEDVLHAMTLAEMNAEDRFVILERASQEFMQCMCTEQGWILEKREGGEDEHYRGFCEDELDTENAEGASIASQILRAPKPRRAYLNYDQCAGAMVNYLHRDEDPDYLVWEKISV